MSVKYDKILAKLREKDLTTAEADALYLKLDQTTQQSVINDAPIFEKGLIIKAGERIYFDG